MNSVKGKAKKDKGDWIGGIGTQKQEPKKKTINNSLTGTKRIKQSRSKGKVQMAETKGTLPVKGKLKNGGRGIRCAESERRKRNP